MNEKMTIVQYWQAPAALAAIDSGASTWHVVPVSDDAQCRAAHVWGRKHRHIAGHFALTGAGGPLAGWLGAARTPGRALRRIRRQLRRTPIVFGS